MPLEFLLISRCFASQRLNFLAENSQNRKMFCAKKFYFNARSEQQLRLLILVLFSILHEVLPIWLCCNMKRRSSAGKAYRILAADIFSHLLFHRINICANRGDPVRLDRFIYPALFLSVHRRAGEPYLVLKSFYPGETRIG